MLIVPDVITPAWAWAKRAFSLSEFRPPDVQVDIVAEPECSNQMVRDYDAVVTMGWMSGPVGPNCWGQVANIGAMFSYAPLSTNFLQRCASRSKNREAALSRLRRFRGVLNINPDQQLQDFLTSCNPNTHLMPTGVGSVFLDTPLFRELTPKTSRRVRVPKVVSRTRDTEALNNSFGLPNRAGGERFRIGWCGKPCKNGRWTPKGYEHVLLPLMANLRDEQFIEFDINTRDITESPLNDQELIAWYDSLDLFLVTSSTEGTPSVLLEAGARGVPAISTAVGVTAPLANNNACILVPPYRDEDGARETVRKMTTTIRALCHPTPPNFTTRHPLVVMGDAMRLAVESLHNWRTVAPVWFRTILQ